MFTCWPQWWWANEWHSLKDVQCRSCGLYCLVFCYHLYLSEALFLLVGAYAKYHGWWKTLVGSNSFKFMVKRKSLITGTRQILEKKRKKNTSQKMNPKCALIWASVWAQLGGRSDLRFGELQEWNMEMAHSHLPFLQRLCSSSPVAHRDGGASSQSEKEGCRPPLLDAQAQQPGPTSHCHWHCMEYVTNN